MKKDGLTVTQIRVPDKLHEYIKEQAKETGISQNSVMLVLMTLGQKVLDGKGIIQISQP